tara:strand:- start:226 stop:444 length:219 start_codon:yes stop_codon:yes gene_type:complete
MAHPDKSKRRKNARSTKSGGITKTDLFNMGNIATGGNLKIARDVYNTFSGWNKNRGSSGSSLQTESKKLKTK